jgi:hypothetical protein
LPASTEPPGATHGPAETADGLHAWFNPTSPLQFRPLEGCELRVIGIRRGRPALTLIEMEDGDNAGIAKFVAALLAELRSRGRTVATEYEPVPSAIRRAIIKGLANARQQ